MRGGIAERGGVRVGHRIIEINGQSVVAMAHEKIVQTLSLSVGEVRTRHDTRRQFSQIIAPHTPLCNTDLSEILTESGSKPKNKKSIKYCCVYKITKFI